MLQRWACCTMFVHSEARARAKSHKVSQGVNRQTGQEDVIFNMPPEHTQHSASAGCASSVLSAYTRVLAGPKPSVVRSHQEVGDLHLKVHVHLEVGELQPMELGDDASGSGLILGGLARAVPLRTYSPFRLAL